MAAFTVACSQQHPRDRVLRPVVSLHPGDVANVQAHQQAAREEKLATAMTTWAEITQWVTKGYVKEDIAQKYMY